MEDYLAMVEQIGGPRAIAQKRSAGERERLSVLFYAEYLVGRGEVQTLIRLLATLDRTKFRPSLVVNRLIGEFVGRVPPDVPVYDLAIGDRKPWRALPQLRRLIRASKPDVVVGISISPSRLLNTLSFVTPHLRVVCLETLFRMEAIKGFFALRRVVTRLVHRRAKATIVGSEAAAEDLESHLGIPRKEITLIPYPAADPMILELAEAPPEAEPGGRGALIVCVGGLFPNKGHKILVEAVARVNDVLPARLALLGTGPEREKLRAQAEELGIAEQMSLLGHHDNPYALMGRADVYVSPSDGEGFDIAHIEALTLGRPVIVTDAPRFKVIRHRISGLIIPPRDPVSMASAILEVLGSDELRATLGDNARAAVADLTPQLIARRWEDILASVAGRGRT